MHGVLVNRLRGLSLPGKSVVRLTDYPDMTLDVYHGRKTTIQQQQQLRIYVITLQNSCINVDVSSLGIDGEKLLLPIMQVIKTSSVMVENYCFVESICEQTCLYFM